MAAMEKEIAALKRKLSSEQVSQSTVTPPVVKAPGSRKRTAHESSAKPASKKRIVISKYASNSSCLQSDNDENCITDTFSNIRIQ